MFNKLLVMNKSEVKYRICNLMNELFGDEFDYLSEESSFYHDAGLDSLDFIELIEAVEKEFGIKLSVWKLDEWKIEPLTLGGLVDMICEVSGK